MIADEIRRGRRTVPEGMDVFRWPEFKALAGRLGVDLNKTIYGVSFIIVPDQPVRVSVEYEGEDTTGSTIVPPEPCINPTMPDKEDLPDLKMRPKI